MQRAHVVPAALEVVGEALRADLRAREDDRAARLRVGEELLEELELLARLAERDALLDRVDGDLLRRDLDVLGAVQLLVGELLDRRRHGRAEQRGLLAPRRALHDVADVVDEAHREHLVGLVEHEDADVVGVEGAAAEVVEHAARRHSIADHDEFF